MAAALQARRRGRRPACRAPTPPAACQPCTASGRPRARSRAAQVASRRPQWEPWPRRVPRPARCRCRGAGAGGAPARAWTRGPRGCQEGLAGRCRRLAALHPAAWTGACPLLSSRVVERQKEVWRVEIISHSCLRITCLVIVAEWCADAVYGLYLEWPRAVLGVMTLPGAKCRMTV